MVVAFLVGVCFPCAYRDGTIRGNLGRLICMGVMALSLVGLLAVEMSVSWTANEPGLAGGRHYEIQLESYSEKEFDRIFAMPMASRLVPKEARGIHFYYQPGFLFGKCFKVRCEVEEEAVRQFFREQQFECHEMENDQKMSAEEVEEIRQFLVDAGCKEDPYSPPLYSTSEKFLVYEDRYSNGGGFFFKYDMDTKTL